MGLRIATNTAAQDVQRNLRVNGSEQTNEYTKLSSGKRINKSSDDAAGMAISKKLEAETRGLRQANRNAGDAISLIQVAEGGLDETTNILIRLRELSIQSASDTVGEKERGYLDEEFQHLVQEADRIAKSTTYGGTPLLKGESDRGTLDFHVGAYAGDNNIIQFDADRTNATASHLGIEGLAIQEKEDANSGLENIDEAIEMVSGYRASLGALQSRLNSTVNNLEIAAVNQDAARSRIEDVDYAASISKLSSINIMKNAGTAVLSQANNIPNGAMRLLT
jgi:flagellin